MIFTKTQGLTPHFPRLYDKLTTCKRAAKPSIIALADSATAVVESIQQRLSVDPTTIRSILHLHSLMREPALIIDTFHQMISQTAGISDDSQLLTTLFEVVQQEQHRSGWLKPLLMETLARVTRPWLEFIEEWIGLGRPVGGEGTGFEGLVERGVFVRIEEETYVDDKGRERTNRNFVRTRYPLQRVLYGDLTTTDFRKNEGPIFHERREWRVCF